MKTGIDWCELDVTAELAGLAAEARANELRVRGLMVADDGEALSRLIVADGVDAVEALLAFARRDDVPLEVRAAAVHFLHGHIHPFRDGNGHAARMLACAILSERYSLSTLLALLRRLQADRYTVAGEMSATVRERANLDQVCAAFLRTLHAAQRDVLPERPGYAHLPLRRVDVSELELVSARRHDRSVYRAGDGRMLKTVA